MKNLKWISILIIIIVMNTTVFAADTSTLTIDEATEKAISYSKTLKTLSENSILAQEDYDDVVSDYLITDQSHETLNLVTRLKSALNELTNISASEELEKESIHFNVINFFFSVLSAEKELELYEQSLEIAEKELQIAEIKKNLGLLSEVDYNTQKLSYQKQAAELSNKELTITNAYRSLNNILGNDTDTRYDLVIDDEYLTFSSIAGTSLTTYINKGLSTSNELAQLKQSVELAKYEVTSYTSLNSSSLQSVQISYAQAQRSLSEAQTNLEQSITDLYNSTLQLEDDYEMKLKDIAEQEKTIELLEIKYNLGTITELELIQAQYELEVLELELETIIFNHNMYKMQLENINLA